MFAAATVDTNEGWTFADNHTSEFPTTTEPDHESNEHPTDWGIAATTTNGWGAPPTAPSPPMSAVGQPRTNDHASLHWTACYDDYCGVHRQMKNDNYYPQRSTSRRRRRVRRTCDCPMPHPEELLGITRERHLDPIKACADWHRGKRVCPDCRFLVNMENHHLRCSAATRREPLADITTTQEDQENTAPPEEAAANDEARAATPAALRDEQISLLHDIVTMLHHTTTRDARRNHVVHRTLAQRMNEFHDADQQQLQQMANTLGAIITEQQRMNEQLQARQQGSLAVRIYCTPIRHRATPTQHDLTGASVWTGDVLSQISRGRLVSASAGAAATLVALWPALITATAATVILRA